jgi:plastocyanin
MVVRICLALVATMLAAAQGSANAQSAQPATVSITVSLTNYAYAPAVLMLKSGTKYRLHLANNSSKDHDFESAAFFANAIVALEDRAKIVSGSVEVGASESVDVTVTPSHAGNYALTCTHFMHAEMGMTGEITVQ